MDVQGFFQYTHHSASGGIINRMNTQINIQFTVPICFSISAASSGEALGMTPGSLKLVLNKVAMTKINKAPPTTGIAGVT